MWPLHMTSHSAANQLATEIFMRRERRRLQARHTWEKIQPNRPMIEHATGLPYQVQHRRSCLHEFTEEYQYIQGPTEEFSSFTMFLIHS